MDLTAATEGGTAAVTAARAADPARYAIGGRAPRLAFAPETREQAADVVGAAARDGLALVPWGAGTALARATAPARYDVALDVTALDRIVTFEPEDLTLTVECGATLERVRAALAPHGLSLALEGAGGGRATIGGVLAANASGARRREWGAPRDRILGARFVTGEGALVRSGGRVVKNVAGYGSHRLLCGSRGGLAVLIEASFKLLPAAAASVALVFELPPARLGDAALWQPFARGEPTAMTVLGPAAARALAGRMGDAPASASGGALALVLGFEADAAWCAAQEARALERLSPALGAPRARLADARARAVLDALAGLEDLAATRATFTSAWRTPEALAALDRAALETLVFHAPAGRLHVFPEAGATTALARALGARKFTWIDGTDAGFAPPAAPAGMRALRARVAAAFDPRGTLAFGREWIERA